MVFIKNIPPEFKNRDVDDGILTEEELVEGQLLLNDESFTLENEETVVVCSWNINQLRAEAVDLQQLRRWMKVDKSPGIIAVGLQEVDMSASALVREETDPGTAWQDSLTRAVCKSGDYEFIAGRQLAGLLIATYVRSDLRSQIRGISKAFVRCGAMGNSIANKGAVGVRFQLHMTTLAFETAHLAAHQTEVEKRNRNFTRIMDQMVYEDSGNSQPILTLSHDKVFFFGDLNYRIDRSLEDTLSLIKEKNYDKLLSEDQLVKQFHPSLAGNSPFIDNKFTSAKPDFAPTYKYDPGTWKYDSSEKKRIPAWTDRVLWYDRYSDRNGTALNEFNANDELLASDHRPVDASFSVKIRRYVTDAKERKRQEIIEKIRDVGLDKYAVPNVVLSKSSVDFGTVCYGECKTDIIELTNKGHAVVSVDIYNYTGGMGGGSSDWSKDWLSVTRCTIRINPGTTEPLNIKCCIDKQAVAEVASDLPFRNTDKRPSVFRSCLVVSALQQKYYVEISARYSHSCFGSKLSILSTLGLVPVTDAYLKPPEEEPLPPTRPWIPKELWFMIDYLSRYGKQARNLFQADLNDQDFSQVRQHLDTTCKPFEMSDVTPCNMSQVLLVFLKDLQEPVIPYKYYDQCLSRPGEILTLPVHHSNTLCYITSFLKFLLSPENRSHNNLTPDLLAHGFAPVLLQRSSSAAALSAGQVRQERLKAFTYVLKLLE